MQGKYTQAVRCFRRAIAILPEFAAMHFNLGNALAAAGDKAGAVAAYRRDRAAANLC